MSYIVEDAHDGIIHLHLHNANANNSERIIISHEDFSSLLLVCVKPILFCTHVEGTPKIKNPEIKNQLPKGIERSSAAFSVVTFAVKVISGFFPSLKLALYFLHCLLKSPY